jgi:mRNA interferase MazF
LVPFPFTNQTDSKHRPAVIVSNRTYNAAKPDAVMMAITTKLHQSPELGEIRVDQWQAAARLLVPPMKNAATVPASVAPLVRKIKPSDADCRSRLDGGPATFVVVGDAAVTGK